MQTEINAFRVGGFVRDTLLGKYPNDCDWVVVGQTPEIMLTLGFQQVGADFPVFLHPDSKEEYALARTEKKSAPGYKGFNVFSSPRVTLEQDLLRRDLTINAIAMDKNGRIIDPHNGVADLDAGILRHVSQSFCEDPVRVLRVARFAARLGFSVAAETNELMRTLVNRGELDSLTPERVWTELSKALSEQKPSVFFSVLHNCGALEKLFPELNQLIGVPQCSVHHPEIDSFRHTMLALDLAAELSEDLTVRFAALVHDLGKSLTPTDLWPKHIKHELAGVPLVRELTTRLKAPKAFSILGELVCQFHLHAHKALELRPNSVLKLLESLDAFRHPNRVDAFLLACEADARGRLGYHNRAYPQKEYLQLCFQATKAVSAKKIVLQGHRGKAVGERLRDARIQVIKDIKGRYKNGT